MIGSNRIGGRCTQWVSRFAGRVRRMSCPYRRTGAGLSRTHQDSQTRLTQRVLARLFEKKWIKISENRGFWQTRRSSYEHVSSRGTKDKTWRYHTGVLSTRLWEGFQIVEMSWLISGFWGRNLSVLRGDVFLNQNFFYSKFEIVIFD